MSFREEIRPIVRSNPEYPKLLKKIKSPPKTLWVRGAGINNDLFHLASIGSRVVEAEALNTLTTFLENVCIAYSDAAQASLVIVSGLAKGVDRVSHEVGLANANTVGVLPTAINRMDPPDNLDIAQAMLLEHQRGTAIVSEYAPVLDGYRSPRNPLARNRITVGMSSAILVSGVSREASGSMKAVMHAHQEHRPIYFLSGTVSQSVKSLLVGVYGAKEVKDAESFVESLILP